MENNKSKSYKLSIVKYKYLFQIILCNILKQYSTHKKLNLELVDKALHVLKNEINLFKNNRYNVFESFQFKSKTVEFLADEIKNSLYFENIEIIKFIQNKIGEYYSNVSKFYFQEHLLDIKNEDLNLFVNLIQFFVNESYYKETVNISYNKKFVNEDYTALNIRNTNYYLYNYFVNNRITVITKQNLDSYVNFTNIVMYYKKSYKNVFVYKYIDDCLPEENHYKHVPVIDFHLRVNTNIFYDPAKTENISLMKATHTI